MLYLQHRSLQKINCSYSCYENSKKIQTAAFDYGELKRKEKTALQGGERRKYELYFIVGN